MPDSMIAVVTYFGGFGGPRKTYVSVPRIDELLSEPGPKYFVMPEPEPEPAPRKTGGCFGARPRARGREVVPLE